MRNILVLGVVVEERDPWGGVIDIDRPANNPNEQALFDAIEKALNGQHTPQIPADRSYVGSAEVGMEATAAFELFEQMPFTGTIDAEVILYVE